MKIGIPANPTIKNSVLNKGLIFFINTEKMMINNIVNINSEIKYLKIFGLYCVNIKLIQKLKMKLKTNFC